MGWFDDKLREIGQGSVEEAHVALNELLVRLSPLLREVENRLGGIAHGLLDRVKLNISIEIVPISKAELAGRETDK